MKSKTLAPTATWLPIPRDVAVCPYCDGDLVAMPEAWTERPDGTWEAEEAGLECKNEPELGEGDDDDESSAWCEWLNAHSVLPYVYWLPVSLKALKWLKDNYSFDVKP